MARTAPVRGSMATNAPSTSGCWVIVQSPFVDFTSRITAPGRICVLGLDFSAKPDVAGRSPSPVTVADSPVCNTATTLRELASSTTAAFNSSLSGWSCSASAMRVSISLGLAGRSM